MENPRLLETRSLGTVAYDEAASLQARLVRQRRAARIPDTLLLLQHPHVITLGTASASRHVLSDEAERRLLGIEMVESGRGGDVTYHGPGQLVGYPILDLKPDRKDLHRYLRDLEGVLVEALADWGLPAERKDGLTGVWTPGGKIAAIGVRVSSGWITSHGFALNVSTDLRYFETIVPCGLADRSVTSVERELGRKVPMEEVERAVVRAFARVFGRTLSGRTLAGRSLSGRSLSGGHEGHVSAGQQSEPSEQESRDDGLDPSSCTRRRTAAG